MVHARAPLGTFENGFLRERGTNRSAVRRTPRSPRPGATPALVTYPLCNDQVQRRASISISGCQPVRRRGPESPYADAVLSCRRRRRRQVRCRRRTEGSADEAQVARPRQHPSHRRWLRHLFAAALRLDGGALPALEELYLADTLASEAATAALMARFPEPDTDYGSENSDEE